MAYPQCKFVQYHMKTKTTKKKVAVRPAANNTNLNVNVEYVEQIADESIATIMALRGLVRMLVQELEDRK